MKVPSRFLMTKRPTEQSFYKWFALCRWTHMDLAIPLLVATVCKVASKCVNIDKQEKINKSVCKGNAFKTFARPPGKCLSEKH